MTTVIVELCDTAAEAATALAEREADGYTLIQGSHAAPVEKTLIYDRGAVQGDLIARRLNHYVLIFTR